MSQESPNSAASDLRRLCRTSTSATLATIAVGHKQVADGWPVTSMVVPASDIDGTPILLISDLADHTRHIKADNRVSLLFTGQSPASSQTTTIETDNARLTVFGRAEPDTTQETRNHYLRAHPDAAQYVDFGDFRFYRITVDAVYWVGGFGKQRRITGQQFNVGDCHTLQSGHDDIVAHMNADHLDALADIVSHYSSQDPSDAWHMHSIDCDGMFLASKNLDFPRLRIDFAETIHTPAEARNILVEMCKKSRA